MTEGTMTEQQLADIETKARATAIVQVTLEVVLSQPWTGEATVAEIQKRATQQALEILRKVVEGDRTYSIRLGPAAGVRIVLNEVRT